MVNYEKVVEELEKENKLSLFAIVQMDDLADIWTLIFAADWVKDNNRMETYKKISRLIDENSNKADVTKVSRMGIFDADHYLVKGLLKYSGEKELNDVKINGNTIHKGIMYYPQPDKINIKKKTA